jgi:hypothetical protein
MKLVSIAALYMAIGVACGAFGAHALRGVLSATDMAICEVDPNVWTCGCSPLPVNKSGSSGC